MSITHDIDGIDVTESRMECCIAVLVICYILNLMLLGPN